MKQTIKWLIGPLLFTLTLGFAPLPYMQRVSLAIALWMIAWWIFDTIPMAATAMLPIVFFPLLGLQSIQATTSSYANPTIYLFLGGFLMALAIEKTLLHERIAFYLLTLFGKTPNGMALGFMVSTAFLSMWISNTACALMMLPMATSAIDRLTKEFGEQNTKNLAAATTLGIAYAANIGGAATLIGTPPNVVLKGLVANAYGIELSFVAWLAWGIPLGAALIAALYFILTKLIYPISPMLISKWSINEDWKVKRTWNKAEKMTAIIFLMALVGWLSSPIINAYSGKKLLDDTIIAVTAGLAMFAVPLNWKSGEGILNWKDSQHLPWGILLLFGGGLAMASGFESSGLLKNLSTNLNQIEHSPILLLIAVCGISIFITELMSNVALTIVLVPIVLTMFAHDQALGITLASSVAVGSSMAFMLPISTPPNAIVFASGMFKIKEMAKAGIWLNLVAWIGICFCLYLVSLL